MQNRNLLRVNGLRNLRLSSWVRFGSRLMRVVHGTDHTSAANMVAVVNGSSMVYDPDKGRGSWVYGPSCAVATQERPEGAVVIDGLSTHQDCLVWCDAYLVSKGVRPLSEILYDAPLLAVHP